MGVKEVQQQVHAAMQNLVSSYGTGDVPRYLACFHPAFVGIFYFMGRRLESLEEWEEELKRFSADGNRVVSCKSSNVLITVLSETSALAVHDVLTVEEAADGTKDELNERESVVWVLDDGRWLVIHEHLSEMPKTDKNVVVGQDGSVQVGDKVVGQLPDQTFS